MGISKYYAYSRTFSYRPWLFLSMIWELRKENYDLAIQVGEGSLTSWVFTYLCGAKKTLGQKGRLQNTYDWLTEGKTNHAYELPSAIASSLGLHCEPLPRIVVSEREHAWAQTFLKHSLTGGIVGVFVGGHLDKRFPLSFWQEQIQELNKLGEKYVVMVGPEEDHYRQYLEQCCGPLGQILPIMPIRQFAAILSHLIMLITPDTGPMHMAAALGVPIIALLNAEKSRKFCPKGIADKTLFRPTPQEVVAMLLASPLIESDRARKEHMLDRRMLMGSY